MLLVVQLLAQGRLGIASPVDQMLFSCLLQLQRSFVAIANIAVQQVPQDDTSLNPPQILILDPSLRTPPTARMLQEWQNRDPSAIGPKAVKQPFLICGPDASPESAEALEKAGACIIRTQLKEGRIPPSALRGILTDLGLRSVMIEGGSRVIASFLAEREVDTVVVTVAPMFIGEGVGVVPREEETKLPQLREVATVAMGKDAVMVATLA